MPPTRTTRAELETALEAEARQAIQELLDWHEAHEAPTLAQIEEMVLKLRQRLGERMAQAVVAAQTARRPTQKPRCQQCGRVMRFKDELATAVESRAGVIRVERGYYYCRHCHAGLFPPRSATPAP
jgi:hypothetical protein